MMEEDDPVLTLSFYTAAAILQAERCKMVKGERQDADGDWAQGFITGDPPPSVTRVKPHVSNRQAFNSPSPSPSPSHFPSSSFQNFHPPSAFTHGGSSSSAEKGFMAGSLNPEQNCNANRTSSVDNGNPRFTVRVDDSNPNGSAPSPAGNFNACSADDCECVCTPLKRSKAFVSRSLGRESGEKWESNNSEGMDDMKFDCDICKHKFGLDFSYPMPFCTCIFCRACIRNFVDVSIESMITKIAEEKEGDFHSKYESLPCPSDSCRSTLPVLSCQDLSPAAFHKWESALSDATLCHEKNSYVKCPNCSVFIEMIPAEIPSAVALSGVPEIDKTVPYMEFDTNGGVMSRHAMCHRLLHRYRCSMCSHDFCGKCQKGPYHLGKTCEENEAENSFGKCLYCEEGRTHVRILSAENSSSDVALGSVVEEYSGWSVHELRRELERRKVDSSWCMEKKELQAVYVLAQSVCDDSGCRKRLTEACTRLHGCGHLCGGVRGEKRCLPCLQDPCRTKRKGVAPNGYVGELPSSEDFCPICGVETLKSSPCIQLECGHILHKSCAEEKVRKGYMGPELSFAFLQCPLCATDMEHPSLARVLSRPRMLRTKVSDMAVERLQADQSLLESPELRRGGQYHGRAVAFALRRFLFYECFRCREPYFGGDRQCGPAPAARGGEEGERERGARNNGRRRYGFRLFGPRDRQNRERENDSTGDNEFNENRPNSEKEITPEDLICGPCIARNSVNSGKCTAGHGDKYIEFKCRYCCSVATYFCFGTTHYCNSCHITRPDFQRSRVLPACSGPHSCPLKVKHPPNGEEFCLGCALCRLKGGVRPKRTGV